MILITTECKLVVLNKGKMLPRISSVRFCGCVASELQLHLEGGASCCASGGSILMRARASRSSATLCGAQRETHHQFSAFCRETGPT